MSFFFSAFLLLWKWTISWVFNWLFWFQETQIWQSQKQKFSLFRGLLFKTMDVFLKTDRNKKKEGRGGGLTGWLNNLDDLFNLAIGSLTDGFLNNSKSRMEARGSKSPFWMPTAAFSHFFKNSFHAKSVKRINQRNDPVLGSIDHCTDNFQSFILSLAVFYSNHFTPFFTFQSISYNSSNIFFFFPLNYFFFFHEFCLFYERNASNYIFIIYIYLYFRGFSHI